MVYAQVVTLTSLRKDIFQHVDRALHGERLEFLYKGVVFRVVPENTTMKKLDRLIGEPTIAPGVDLEAAGAEMSQEMIGAWEKKWDSL